MNYMKRLLHLWPLFGLYGLLVIVLSTTDPFDSPLPVIIIPFTLLFLALLKTFSLLLNMIDVRHKLSRKKRLFIAAGAAWLPVMLLILRSVDQLTGRDAFVLAIFILAFLLYISRIQFKTRR